ncbi:ribonuclease H-like domain-containing protein [Tanacetum coccineum]
MSSDPNCEWEQLHDIDDSDLPLTPFLHPCNNHVHIHEGGDESVLSTQEYIRKVVDDVGEDEDFKGGCLGDIKNYLKDGKLEQVVAIIKSCTLNDLGDLTVTLKDLSVLLILANVSIFSPKPSMHYLNITMRNMINIFHKDTVPGNGSGLGGSGLLMEEEEIVKLMEEEEMDDLDLHVCENVIDQEDLYKFNEEALDLALEEEARQAQAHQEWLEK